MNIALWASLVAVACSPLYGQQSKKEYLVKLKDTSASNEARFLRQHGGTLEEVSRAGQLYKWSTEANALLDGFTDERTEYIQKNHVIRLFENPSIAKNRAMLVRAMEDGGFFGGTELPDNPDIGAPKSESQGADPLLSQSWGMPFINAPTAWSSSPQGEGLVVAVTDTGMDYNHEDLINNVWRNTKEIPNNGVDDDHNGYVDDVIGWDFASNDNKPYDLTKDLLSILMSGGNPGHGTHVSGVIGARYNNSLGTSGVAPKVKIMPLRFINESGQGDSASAIKAIDYAVANGARVINASWGSEGEDEGDKALREAIQRAQTKGVLFVAAAGNGRTTKDGAGSGGYDNDHDAKPCYPSTYGYPNMVSVAAVDDKGSLASFSNWGDKTVQIGAPGVKILSTVPGNQYQDKVIDFGPLMQASWDGTSMATPFVVGALAVIWSQDKNQTADQVKGKLLEHVTKLAALEGKVVTGGHLDLKWLEAR